MKKLVIVGTGLFAQVAREYFDELSQYRTVAFACHREYMESDSIHGLPLYSLEHLRKLFPPMDCEVFVAIGYGNMNRKRQGVFDEVKKKGYQCATFIYPQIKIWSSTEFGENVFVFEDNTIQPHTKIGNNTICWSGNHIGHHSRLGEHCFISSHVVISGSCNIGNNVFIGVNATLHDGLTIGAETLIGAGSIVNKDTNAKTVLVPSATKPFRKTSDQIGF